MFGISARACCTLLPENYQGSILKVQNYRKTSSITKKKKEGVEFKLIERQLGQEDETSTITWTRRNAVDFQQLLLPFGA